MSQFDLVVAGGGVSGLAAAWEVLRQCPDSKVAVVEASARFGGKLVSHPQDGFLLEGAADSFLTRKPWVLDLVRDLGAEDRLLAPRPENRQTWILTGGELHRLPPGFSGLVPSRPELLDQADFLDPGLKAEILAEKERPVRSDRAEESVAEFFVRRFGRRAFDQLFEPLLTGIFSGDSQKLSLQAAFPQLAAIEASGSTLMGHWSAQNSPAETKTPEVPAFMTFREGMGELPALLVSQLVRAGAVLHSGDPLVSLTLDRETGRWKLQTRTQVWEARSVILALAPAAASRILKTFPQGEASSRVLAQIPSASASVFHLGFAQEDLPDLPPGTGFVSRRGENPAFTACTFSSRKWENRAPAGTHLLRFYVPGEAGDDEGALTGDLVAFLGRFSRGRRPQPLTRRLFRWTEALPQPNLGHLDRLAQLESLQSQTPGLYLAGAYFQGVGLPDSLSRARTCAGLVLETWSKNAKEMLRSNP